jgi:thioredoxin reductase
MKTDHELVIIGGGPAGLSAGLYASRARLNSVLIEKGFIGTFEQGPLLWPAGRNAEGWASPGKTCL